MVAFNNVWNQAMSLFSNLFFRPDWRNLLDVVIVAFVVYQILKLFIHTRANSVLKGVGIILLLTWLSEILQLNAINWLLLQLINTGALWNRLAAPAGGACSLPWTANAKMPSAKCRKWCWR